MFTLVEIINKLLPLSLLQSITGSLCLLLLLFHFNSNSHFSNCPANLVIWLMSLFKQPMSNNSHTISLELQSALEITLLIKFDKKNPRKNARRQREEFLKFCEFAHRPKLSDFKNVIIFLFAFCYFCVKKIFFSHLSQKKIQLNLL